MAASQVPMTTVFVCVLYVPFSLSMHISVPASCSCPVRPSGPWVHCHSVYISVPHPPIRGVMPFVADCTPKHTGAPGVPNMVVCSLNVPVPLGVATSSKNDAIFESLNSEQLCSVP